MFVLWFVLTMDADMEKPIIFCKYYRLSERWYWIVRPSFKPWKRLTDEEKRMRELPDDSERMKVYARVIRQRDGTKLVNIENASHSLLFSHTFD